MASKPSKKSRTRRSPSPSKARSARRNAPAAMEGSFIGHRDGFGFVTGLADSKDLFIPAHFIDSALDGDHVRVEILPPREGEGKSTAAKVVEVIQRRATRLRGRIFEEGDSFWLQPVNARLPDMFVDPQRPSVAFQSGDWVVAEITEFPEDRQTAPYIRILSIVEDGDSPDGLVDIVTSELELLTGFSPETQAEMDALPKEISAGPWPQREDLTALPFVTIDGPDARDFDDAVCLLPASPGQVRLLVSIADAAEFVREGMAVDADAQEKGTSVYFPHRAEPMLPEGLSSGLCSLKPGVPRLTLTCEMELDASSGEVKSHRIYASVIRSRARLTYDQVQQFFDSGKSAGIRSGKIRQMLLDMRDLADTLRERRHQRGALGFVMPEARFVFSDSAEPVDVTKAFPSDTTRLIEQFMLEANETVAAHCTRNRIPILYRVHDPPPEGDRQALLNTLWNYGISTRNARVEEPGWINDLLAQAESHPEREQIVLALIKSMSQARYRAHNDGHFGLAAAEYAHFTSPIRRYPDLLLHRALKRHLVHKGDTEESPSPLYPEAGEELSDRERVAAQAEAQVSRMFRTIVMESHLGEQFDGVVTGLGRFGLSISLEQPYVTGTLPIEQLHGGKYRFDPQRNVLQGARRADRIRTGMSVRVQVVRCNRISGTIEFVQVAQERGSGRKQAL